MSDSTNGLTTLSYLRHDLRTLVGQVLGFTELLLVETVEAGHTAYSSDLEKVRSAAKTLLNVINDNLTDERMTLTGEVVAQSDLTIPPFSVGGLASLSAMNLAPQVASGSPMPAFRLADMRAEITGRILVADDTESNLEVLTRQLERQGHRVDCAVNGREAIALLRSGSFDLVLLDIMMPELDGYGTLLEIKSDPKLRHLPVIMISALDELNEAVRCIERGAEDFLPKPFNPTLLRARIGAGLEKKRFFDQERRYIKTIEETQARLKAELAEAENYVRSILPAPLVSGSVMTDWRFIPSTELGGDSFGYHWIDPDHFALYLLDVCGHGVGAALLSVTAINVLRNAALPDVDFRDPGAMLTALNEAFLMERQNDMYFTIWYGVWQPSTRRLTFSTAGHPPALLATTEDGGGRRIDSLKGAGLILGGMSGTVYRTHERMIPGPAQLYVVSDGTYEIIKPDGTMWDYTEFQASLAAPSSAGESDLDRLYNRVRAVHGPGPLEDDFSAVRFAL